jgi:glycosyltransferase involved in cell wall biosynthesis
MSNTSPYISIVSPVYLAEKIVDLLVSRIVSALESNVLDFEIILVDDGSPDNSWARIQQICEKDTRVKGIKLSRNFGQHYAITAGLDNVQGEWIVVMDCDLQDQPEEIIKLVNKAKEGFDIVFAKRSERKDIFFRRVVSRLFYKCLTYLTGSEQDASIANFGIFNKKVIQSVCQMRESIRYFPVMVNWVGFKQTKINVEHSRRMEGKTSYNLRKLLNLSLDIILAFSDKPIRIIIKIGLVISIFSFSFAILTIYRFLNGDITVIGYTSLIVSIWFLCGLILMTLGIVGLYVGKTFEGVKKRPIYIVSERLN